MKLTLNLTRQEIKDIARTSTACALAFIDALMDEVENPNKGPYADIFKNFVDASLRSGKNFIETIRDLRGFSRDQLDQLTKYGYERDERGMTLYDAKRCADAVRYDLQQKGVLPK